MTGNHGLAVEKVEKVDDEEEEGDWEAGRRERGGMEKGDDDERDWTPLHGLQRCEERWRLSCERPMGGGNDAGGWMRNAEFADDVQRTGRSNDRGVGRGTGSEAWLVVVVGEGGLEG